jgi:hypothetical protein
VGEKASISVQSLLGDHEFGDFFTAALDPEFARSRVEVTIRYENVQLKPYAVVQSIEPKSQRITGFRTL